MLTPALRKSFTRQLCNGAALIGRWRRASSAMAASSAQIAVLGGGLAGAYCANLLAEQGFRITLFDMGRSGFGELSSNHTAASKEWLTGAGPIKRKAAEAGRRKSKHTAVRRMSI